MSTDEAAASGSGPGGSDAEADAGQDSEPATGLQRHVVLVAPEVHWNTGNIGRTCLGAGARLHLIRPLGFSLEDRRVRRAGLDYWHKVQLTVWNHFDHFLEGMQPRNEEIALLTARGRLPHWQLPAIPRLFLIFGSETAGLPADIRQRYEGRAYSIPIRKEIRCLNLSTAVAVALYETLRGRAGALRSL